MHMQRFRKQQLLAFYLAVMFLIIGCIESPSTIIAPPTVINHSDLSLAHVPDNRVIAQALGCTPEGKSSVNIQSACAKMTQEMGCDELQNPERWQWTPDFIFVECIIYVDENNNYEQIKREGYIKNIGIMITVVTRVIVASDDGPILIKTKSELLDAMRPIDSAQKAIIYTTLTSSFRPMFFEQDSVDNQRDDPRMTYLVDTLEDSHLVKTENGYDILLYDSPSNCTPWKTYAVWVHITESGNITVSKKELISQFDDGSCI